MNATIFRLGLRQSLLPALSVVAAIAATLGVAEWLAARAFGDPNSDLVFTVLWGPFLLWSGFLAGGRPFSREFRERHFLLIHALPVERHVSWASLALGGLTAGVSSLLLALLLRPALLTAWRSESSRQGLSPTVVAILLVLYLILFAAGSCYALLLDGTALHAVGFVATFVTLAETGVLLVALAEDPRMDDSVIAEGLLLRDVVRVNVPTDGVLACAALVFVLYAGFALAFFVRGEFPAIRVRWRNAAALVAGHFAFFVAAGAVLEARSRTRPFVLEDRGMVLSPDGKYLAAAERREGYPRFARVRVIDTRTGRLLGSAEIDGLRSLTWSPDATQILAAEHDVSPWRRLGYLRVPSDAVVRLTLEGKVVERERFESSRILSGPWLLRDSWLVLLRSGTVGRIVALGTGDSSKDLLQIPDARQLELGQLSDGPRFLAARFEKGPSRVWLLGPGVEELSGAREETSSGPSPSRVLSGTLVTAGKLGSELAHRFPLPSRVLSGSGPARYVSWAFAERPPWVFAFVPIREYTQELHARDPAGGAWRLLVRALALPHPSKEPVDQELLQYGECTTSGVFLDRPLWLCRGGVVVEANPSQCEVVVHDGRTGRQHRLEPSAEQSLSVSSLPGGELAIFLQSSRCPVPVDEKTTLAGAQLTQLTTALQRELTRSGKAQEALLLGASSVCRRVSAQVQAQSRDQVYLIRPGSQGPEEYSLRCEPQDDSIGALVGALADGGLIYFRTPRTLKVQASQYEETQVFPVAPLRVSYVLVARQGQPDMRIWPPRER